MVIMKSGSCVWKSCIIKLSLKKIISCKVNVGIISVIKNLVLSWASLYIINKSTTYIEYNNIL